MTGDHRRNDEDLDWQRWLWIASGIFLIVALAGTTIWAAALGDWALAVFGIVVVVLIARDEFRRYGGRGVVARLRNSGNVRPVPSDTSGDPPTTN